MIRALAHGVIASECGDGNCYLQCVTLLELSGLTHRCDLTVK